MTVAVVTSGPCLCGDPCCPWCGPLQGGYDQEDADYEPEDLDDAARDDAPADNDTL
jgi:hypothetical protein